ncbi:MAG: DUF2834 domain-containing protein [Alcanivoracaceae bacterium]|nr:DUF2834 domain-containing protein [Alcanivoracaceae bacterium]
MSERLFRLALILVAIGFTAVFCVVVVPPLVANPDVFGAFAAGFVNPYAAGYSSDVLFCWAALAIFVVYEARVLSVKHGWLCLVLGIVPGVAVGLALYFLIRHGQITQTAKSA